LSAARAAREGAEAPQYLLKYRQRTLNRNKIAIFRRRGFEYSGFGG